MPKENQVIHIRSEALYALIDEIIDHVEQRQGMPAVSRWINGDEAMKLLNIRSKTTLIQLRNEGKIRFSQPSKKAIFYDRYSLTDYMTSQIREIF